MLFRMKYFYSFLIIFYTLVSCSPPMRRAQTENIATLKGVGSSFVLPMSSELFKDFQEKKDIAVDYTADNSYLGMTAILEGTADFALSEIYMNDKQLKDQAEILHIPIAVAGVNFAYHIKEDGFSMQDDPIYLTPDIIAKMYLGQITKWNDPEIVAINKKVAIDKDRVLPDLDIVIIHRADNAGDTVLLSRFLSKASPVWRKEVGTKVLSKLDWEIGITGDTALDLMQHHVQTLGAFTYTTMIYGLQNNMPLARVRNFLGTYGRGCNFRSLEAMKVAEPTADNRIDLTYPQHPSLGKEAAVATAFMYMIVRKEQNYNNRTKEQAQATVDLLSWLLSPVAQIQLDPIFFAGLTPKFRKTSRATLAKMTYNGEALTPSPERTNRK